MIRLAIQKSGRLSEDSIALIRECGIDFPDPKNKLRCVSGNFPVELLFLRDDDIPGYVRCIHAVGFTTKVTQCRYAPGLGYS